MSISVGHLKKQLATSLLFFAKKIAMTLVSATVLDARKSLEVDGWNFHP